jgi:hypothetical protein
MSRRCSISLLHTARQLQAAVAVIFNIEHFMAGIYGL